MTDIVARLVFWGCGFVVVICYIGYPVLLFFLRGFRRSETARGHTPHITLVISAYNEGDVIGRKLENTLALDYPPEQLDVVVISDASDDGTDDIVRQFFPYGVVLRRQEPRQGKSAGLRKFVPLVGGEIIVFSDANSMYQRDALRKLVRHFADPQIGFVIGYQAYVDDGGPASRSESVYWRYETWLKIQESRIGSVVSGDGAIMAIRSELFEPLRDDDISDFYLPLRIIVRGYRGILEPEAVCWEQTASSLGGEFRRRMRIVNRAFGGVLRVPQALNPLRVGFFAIQLLLHRVLRWFVPFALAGMFVSSGLLAWQEKEPYGVFFWTQCAFYGAAIAGAAPGLNRLKPLYVASYFCLINLAAAIGIVQRLLGKQVACWTPERAVGPAGDRVSSNLP